VEAGSNSSTVTLRVIGGDEKGSFKSETVLRVYGRESQGTRTPERLRWQGPAACTNDRPVLSSERAPTKMKTVTDFDYDFDFEQSESTREICREGIATGKSVVEEESEVSM
jgi:hypothetical protein